MTFPFQPSSIETIDYAVFDFVNEKMGVSATTNKGWKKVPVIFAGNERAFTETPEGQERNDGNKTLIYPLITIERTSIAKNVKSKGTIYNNIFPERDVKGGSIKITKRIQQEKTSNFANADSSKMKGTGDVGNGQINFPKRNNQKIVYQTITIPIPVYCEVHYKIRFMTEYQQQINEMVTPFIVVAGQINKFRIQRDGHSYEAFLPEDFTQDNNIGEMKNEPRKFITEIDLRVYGYLVGPGDNAKTPDIVVRENAVELKLPRERVIFGDIPPWLDGKYRER